MWKKIVEKITNKQGTIAIVGVVIGLLTLIVAFFALPGLNDFTISVDSMDVPADYDTPALTSVKVDFGILYFEDVCLKNGSLPSGIHVQFKPDSLTRSGKFDSIVAITIDKNVNPGYYWIPIVGIGSDGKQHECQFKLKVDKNEQMPALSEAPIPTSTETPIHIETGAIYVSTSPSGANIVLDGVYQGETPKTLENVTQGAHTISLNLEGYNDWSQNIRIEAGKTTQIFKKLKTHEEPVTSATTSMPTETITSAPATTQTETATPTPTLTSTPVPTPTSTSTPVSAPMPTSTSVPSSTPTSTPTSTPEVKITYPSNAVSVKTQETVTGTAKNIPTGYALQVYVYAYPSNKYYPQRWTTIQNEDWSVSPVYFGDGNTLSGTKYDLIVVLADQNAQNKFDNYFTTAEEKNDWAIGMSKIPDGATEYGRITVTRA